MSQILATEKNKENNSKSEPEIKRVGPGNRTESTSITITQHEPTTGQKPGQTTTTTTDNKLTSDSLKQEETPEKLKKGNLVNF